MDEIDAQGRQLLVDRPLLTRGRLSVYRETGPCGTDDWFPRLNVTLKKSGSDEILWQWTTHSLPVDFEEPPPYGEDLLFEKYFELDTAVRSPRGLEVVFELGRGVTERGSVEQFSASLYLYPASFDDRGVQIGVLDFRQGLNAASTPMFARFNFPW
ncbi:MAG: hypothetical protein SFV17_04125 [Candidatus Obscuribacter sp.]|nr:hypothetical protein [Candidatus Melainabacteria bacterium]MDX1985855.1 hypothetical protein [Candidatus Obscuribacter sp.]